MRTFDQALFDLYEGGRISMEDALRNADSVSELKLAIKLNGTRGDEITGDDEAIKKPKLSIDGGKEEKPIDGPASFSTSPEPSSAASA